MREIKFRVWFQNKISLLEDHVYITCISGELVVGEEINDWGFDEYRGAILMQYTGLKDKNGKEIYEGDIVRTDCGTKYVRFIEGIFVATSDSNYSLNQFDELEVIGNIYENPEMLKGDE